MPGAACWPMLSTYMGQRYLRLRDLPSWRVLIFRSLQAIAAYRCAEQARRHISTCMENSLPSFQCLLVWAKLLCGSHSPKRLRLRLTWQGILSTLFLFEGCSTQIDAIPEVAKTMVPKRGDSSAGAGCKM